MADSDRRDLDFPTYATLTQTAAWASTVSPVDAEVPAARIDSERERYVEGALLGRGGMGKVVLAKDARIGREVAVKEIHTQHALTAEEQARFLREARVQGQLEHPSIVPVYDIDQRPDGTIFFTMRRVLGKTLHTILEEVRASAPNARTQHELLTAFATVCLAIDYAHSRGVIHRDLKPANIMLGEFGEVYVLDWGLAKLVNDAAITEREPQRLSSPGDLMGTPMYMAPEQMADPEVSKAADIFSLGAILFEILTLVPLRDPKAPFVPADARPTSRAPSRGVAPELDVICVKATADEPADRYASARALQEAVSRFLEGDRDRELRKGRAAAHARAAREALGQAESQGADYEAARGVAMRELTRALAFDASNRDAVAMLGEILAKPPRTVPDEVRKQIDADSIRTSRAFARYIGPTMASWFLFLPPLLAIGIHDWHVLPLIVVPVFLAMILGFWQASHRIWSTTSQITTLIVVMIALSSVTFLYGPLVVTPAMISSAAVVVQAFPVKALRRTALVSALVLMTLLVVLELTGVTSVYAFAGGHWSVLPQLVELPRVGTLVIMLAIHMGTMILPSMFISQLRGDLARAQQNQLLQAWHFRRLGDQLMQV